MPMQREGPTDPGDRLLDLYAEAERRLRGSKPPPPAKEPPRARRVRVRAILVSHDMVGMVRNFAGGRRIRLVDGGVNEATGKHLFYVSAAAAERILDAFGGLPGGRK